MKRNYVVTSSRTSTTAFFSGWGGRHALDLARIVLRVACEGLDVGSDDLARLVRKSIEIADEFTGYVAKGHAHPTHSKALNRALHLRLCSVTHPGDAMVESVLKFSAAKHHDER